MFGAAIDLAKGWITRASAVSQKLGLIPELPMIAGYHKMLNEIFERGDLSKESTAFVQDLADTVEGKNQAEKP